MIWKPAPYPLKPKLKSVWIKLKYYILAEISAEKMPNSDVYTRLQYQR